MEVRSKEAVMSEEIVIQSSSRILQDAARYVLLCLYLGICQSYGEDKANKPIATGNGVFYGALKEIAQNRQFPEWLNRALLAPDGNIFSERLSDCMVDVIRLAEKLPDGSLRLSITMETANYLFFLAYAGQPLPEKAELDEARRKVTELGSKLLREIGRYAQNSTPHS